MANIRATAGMYAQTALTKMGRVCSKRVIHWLNATANYLEVGRWFREQGLRPEFVHRDKYELFRAAAQRIAGKRLLYLEFGVWEGRTIRRWAAFDAHPESHFHGFDSFQGLPERWNELADRGAYSAGGVIPQIDDARVRFYQGWFNETLPSYEPPEHDVLFANLDADLYESTKIALDAIAPYVRPGTYLYFDEFSDRFHEMRAFIEFAKARNLGFKVFGATPHLTCVIFEVTSIDRVPLPDSYGTTPVSASR